MKHLGPLSMYKALKGGQLLGLAVRTKFIGVAISDPCGRTASPLSFLRRESDFLVRDLETLISQSSVVGVVIGMPRDRLNYLTKTADQVTELVGYLEKTGRFENLMCTYWNEAFTSKSVQLLLKPFVGLSAPDRKRISDEFAAAYILQGYLDYATREVKMVSTSEESKDGKPISKILEAR